MLKKHVMEEEADVVALYASTLRVAMKIKLSSSTIRTVTTYSCVWYRKITSSNMRAMSVKRWHCTSKIIFCSAVKSLHCMLENGVDLDLS